MSLFEAIVVTGTPFSGKTTLAKVLAEQFNWKYFSVSEMWKEGWRKKYPKGDTSFENYMLEVSDDDHKETDRRAGEVISQGHVVGDARYGFLYRDPQVLIIFTQCDVDARAKRALEINAYPGKDFAQVKELLEQQERDDADRCQALYQTDFRDSKNYDLLFDTTDAAPDEAVEKILALK